MTVASTGLTRRSKILFACVAGLLLAQLAQPDRTSPTTDPAHDLIAITQPSVEVEQLLRVACYDCHSNATIYPWYSRITPVNFWLDHHVDEGREEFNMSTWGGRKVKWQRHKAEEAVELLEKGEMPLDTYTWMHGEARLNEVQRITLIGYFTELRGEQ